MIKRIRERIDDREYHFTYSDKALMIERDGVRYAEAYDPISVSREYIETDQPIYTEELLEQMPEEAKKKLLEKASALGITITY